MDFSSFWNSFSGGGGGGGDQGDPIGESLRIRTADNSTTLSKNNFSGSTPTTWTVSYWMKLGRTSALWNTFGSLTGSYYVGHGSIVSGNQFTSWALSTALGRTLRDYGAWYHLVHTFDNDNSRNYRVYVNGDLTLDTNISWPSNPNFMVNGGNNYVPQVPAVGAFEGYLADFYAIDGSILAPTTFGRFNASGVWVPVDPTKAGRALDNAAAYGTNGFHLTFADPSNIGKDVSGNGNDFTATGFDLEIANPTNVYIEPNATQDWQMAADTSSLVGTIPTTPAQLQTTETLLMVLTTAVNNVTVELTNGSASGTSVYASLDGSLNSWTLIYSGTFNLTQPLSSATPFKYLRFGATSPWTFGTIKEPDPFVNPTYDLMRDSPTNNFATLNPIWANESPSSLPMITSDANLSESSATAAPTPGTISIDSPSYCEFVIGSTPYYVGIWDINIADTTDFLGGSAYGNRSLGIYTDGSIYVSGGVVGTALLFNAGDVVGLAYDPTSRELFQWVNGVAANSGNAIYTLPAEVEKWTFVSNSNASKQSINFGQQPFRYTPPAGFEPLSTANMPTPTILDGRDHFQAITGPGANILTDAQAAFPSGLWWIKDRVNVNQHQLVDSVRGGNLAYQMPSNNGDQAYAAPAGDSVAWCWNYNAANPSVNGFEIQTYTGDGVYPRQFTHSLGKAPEFVHVCWRGAAGDQQVHSNHVSFNNFPNSLAYLSDSGAAFSNSAFDGTWDATQWGVGGSATNTSGRDYVAYLWTSVPGYSAFGSYTGNANVDGPFVYLGFKPAFVMIKSTGTENWYIRDSTTSPTNPANNYYVANTTTNEVVSTTQSSDFLSNGFKLRTTNTAWNASGQTYIYAAFAENPFGGQNVAPAAAR